jgi:hypothetical protein
MSVLPMFNLTRIHVTLFLGVGALSYPRGRPSSAKRMLECHRGLALRKSLIDEPQSFKQQMLSLRALMVKSALKLRVAYTPIERTGV